MGEEMDVEPPAEATEAATEAKAMPKKIDASELSAPIVSAIKPDDLYAKMKNMEQEKDFLDVQEQYIKDEIKNLKRELIRARPASPPRRSPPAPPPAPPAARGGRGRPERPARAQAPRRRSSGSRACPW